MKIRNGIVLLCLWLSYTANAQFIDSLKAVLDTARNEQKVKTLNELFRAHLQFDPVTAIGYAREALNLGTEINDKRGSAAAYNNIGVAYRSQGAFDKALEYYIHSLRLYEELEHKEGIATTKNNISTVYSIKGDYSPALKYLEESHKLLVELNDQKKLVGSLNNLGILNMDLSLYDNALAYFRESYQLSDSLGAPFTDPMNNIGNVYFKQNNFDKAIEYYQKGLALERSNNNRLGMLNTLTNIGIAYTKAEKPEPAQRYLSEAYLLARELHANAEIPAILKNSSYNLLRQGNVLKAYEVLLQYDSAREKVYGEQSSRKIAQMEMALELSDKEREYEALKKTAELKTLQLKNSRLFIIMIILGVILIVGLINFFFTDRLKELFRQQ
jgi:tetratricopeptide (TPR) repeat protein